MPQDYNQNQQINNLKQLSYISSKKKRINPFILLLGGFITLVCILLIFILVINFFNTTTPQVTKNKVTLKFWSYDINENEIEKIIKSFTDENPNIEVVYERQTDTGYDERIKTRLYNNSTNIANIFEVSDYLIPEIYSKLAPQTDSTTRSRYPLTLMNNTAVSNIFYGTPFRFDSLVLAYNKAHLAEISASIEDISKQDWSSLVSTTRLLTKKTTTTDPQTKKVTTKINRAGIAIGSPNTVTNATNTFKLLLLQNNTFIYNSATSKFNLSTNSKFNEVTNFYTKFVKENIWDDSLGDDINAFINGKVSIILVTSKDIDEIQRLSPNMDFGTALPARIGNLKYLSLSKSLVIPNYMPNRAESIKFIEYITRPENSIKLYNNKDKSTFIPAQTETLRLIPKQSSFAVFSNIHTLSENYYLPNNQEVTDVIDKYLLESYTKYYKSQNEALEFKIDSAPLETSLNRVLTNQVK